MTALAQWTVWWVLPIISIISCSFSIDSVKKPLALLFLAGLSFTVLSSESAYRENNESLISIVSFSIYIMKSSRSGSHLWCLLIFGSSLFHLSIRPAGSFEVIIHIISDDFKVFYL